MVFLQSIRCIFSMTFSVASNRNVIVEECERLQRAEQHRRQNSTLVKYDYRKPQQQQQNNGAHSGTVTAAAVVVDDFRSDLGDDKVFPPANPPDLPPPLESEFSNSPKFLADAQSLIERLAESDSCDAFQPAHESFLSNNSNFYTEKIVPADVPQVLPPLQSSRYVFYPENDSNSSTNENNNNGVDLDGKETKLPFKKRRMSVVNAVKEEISYPAKKMISIAEIEPLEKTNARPFKTPAERKEMPPLPVYFDANPVVTDQFNINNQTFNNATINYHMGNVPVPFIPAYFPQILLPFNGAQTNKNKKSTGKR